MKNYEKYSDKIREFNGGGFCHDFVETYILKSINAKCEAMDCPNCRMLQMLWLLDEYKEPKEPETDWSKVEVDTPILVRDVEDEEWNKQHFAEYKSGVVYTWRAGKTSWSESYMAGWEYAKLAESEDE